MQNRHPHYFKSWNLRLHHSHFEFSDILILHHTNTLHQIGSKYHTIPTLQFPYIICTSLSRITQTKTNQPCQIHFWPFCCCWSWFHPLQCQLCVFLSMGQQRLVWRSGQWRLMPLQVWSLPVPLLFVNPSVLEPTQERTQFPRCPNLPRTNQ